MGTFHADAHELHGITCVIETTGPRTFVGRVDTIDGRGIVILDADLYEEGLHEDVPGASTKAAWIEKAARVGHWPRHPRVVVPVADVASVRRLGDVATSG